MRLFRSAEKREARNAFAREMAAVFFKKFLAREPEANAKLHLAGVLEPLLTRENRLKARDYFFRLNYGNETGDGSFAAAMQWGIFSKWMRNAGKPLGDSRFIHEIVEMRQLEKVGIDLNPGLKGAALSNYLTGIFDANPWAHAGALLAENIFLAVKALEQKIRISLGTAAAWNPTYSVAEKLKNFELLHENRSPIALVEGESAPAQAFFQKLLEKEKNMLVDSELYGKKARMGGKSRF